MPHNKTLHMLLKIFYRIFDPLERPWPPFNPDFFQLKYEKVYSDIPHRFRCVGDDINISRMPEMVFS